MATNDLLPHSQSLVKWHPWGQKAFDDARARGVPIFLFIGYNTSHWCHLMDKESFRKPNVAKLLNDSFVCIKVDRDERPDIAKVYWTFAGILEGDIEWPLNVFLSYDKKPIMGGLYYPRTGFLLTLRSMKKAWEDDRQRNDLIKCGDFRYYSYLTALSSSTSAKELSDELPKNVLYLCAKKLAWRYNEAFGGLGSASKFPRPVVIQVMLYQSKKLREAGKSGEATEVLEMVSFTLKCMARWAIHDHIGGGFHRIGNRFRNIVGGGLHQYIEDECWSVPYFEKLLYDQAQLVNAYLDAFSFTRDRLYSCVCRDILDFLRRDMNGQDGQFYSAVDADSESKGRGKKKVTKEGAFYLWTTRQVENILGENATLFKDHYKIESSGNCVLPQMSDPQGDFRGKNVLIETEDFAAIASKLGMSRKSYLRTLGMCREKIFNERFRRPSPYLDKKVIVSWNGLTISSLARASKILKGDPEGTKFNFPLSGCDPEEYMEVAEKAASFIKRHLYNKRRRELYHSLGNESSMVPGFLDDYAFLISGLLDLYECGGGLKWLVLATELQETQDKLFLDLERGGYYNTTNNDDSVILRVREDEDGELPSGNSVSVINLIRMASMFSGHYRRQAEQLLEVFKEALIDRPTEVPLMCCAADMLSMSSRKLVVIVHNKPCVDEFNNMLVAAHASFNPNRTVIHIDATNAIEMQFWEENNSSIAQLVKSVNFAAHDYKVVAFVSKEGSNWSRCVTKPMVLKGLLSDRLAVSQKKRDRPAHCVGEQWKPMTPSPRERRKGEVIFGASGRGVMSVHASAVGEIETNLDRIHEIGVKVDIFEGKSDSNLRHIVMEGRPEKVQLAGDMVWNIVTNRKSEPPRVKKLEDRSSVLKQKLENIRIYFEEQKRMKKRRKC